MEKEKRKVQRKTVRQFKNNLGVTFHAGDTVKLTYKAFKTYDDEAPGFAGRILNYSKIASLLSDTKGTVALEQRLGGFYTWNVNDLEKVRSRQ